MSLTKLSPLLAHGIARRLIIAVVLFSSLITLIITVYQLYRDYRHDLALIDAQLEQINNVHLRSIADSLWVVDQRNLKILIDGVFNLPGMQYLEVKDNEKVWVSSGIDKTERVITRQYPLTYKHLDETREIGTLTVVFNLEEIYQRLIDKTIVILISNGIKTFLVAGFILLIFHFLITRHLLTIVQYLRDRKINKITTPLKLNREQSRLNHTDELDMLVNEFNLMRQDLRKSFNFLKKSEDRFYQLADNIDQVFCLVKPDWTEFFYISPAYEKSWGLNAEKLYENPHLWIQKIHPEDREQFNSDKKKKPGEIDNFIDFKEYRIKTTEKIRWIKLRAYPITDRRGDTIRLAGIAEDITRQKHAEESLRRSQKMDAVGQMAGGIAHDFNNILSIIIGNLSFLKREVARDEKALRRVNTADKAAQRAAILTRQLLGFSSKQAQQLQATDINQVIQEMKSLISHSITPEVEVEYGLSSDLWVTEIDPSEFEDALLNLVLNARDAMNGSGKLTLETTNKLLDDEYAKNNPDTKPGEYIELAINDTGMGIPTRDIDRIFDPFHTTKPRDKGTGLGLSMVFGFIQRSKGHIKVYSELGIGTTIRCYFPRSTNRIKAQQSADSHEHQLPRGRETVLAVDDEKNLLQLVKQYLEDLGYKVVTASNGQQALDVLKERQDISLLFSDVVMPGSMNGYELAEQATQLQPELKVLLTSGYTSKSLYKNGQARFRHNLLNKPYNQVEIATKVRLVLDG